MHEGDISAKVSLSKLKSIKHLYALGAIENLRGEIQIFNSKPYNTSVVDSSLIFDNSFRINVLSTPKGCTNIRVALPSAFCMASR